MLRSANFNYVEAIISRLYGSGNPSLRQNYCPHTTKRSDKTVNILSWIQPATAPLPVSAGGNDYARLIVENLPYLEKQCRRAVSRCADGAGAGYGGDFSPGGASCDNEADELLNELLDHLKADDFRVLRQFKGKAKLTTYLTTIIANLVVDLVRKKKGRSRVRERAREMGEVAERLYDAVYRRGHSLGEAHGFLEATWGITAGHAELSVMLERMRGREAHLDGAGECWPCAGKEIVTEEGIEIAIPDPARSAEQMLADDHRERLSRRVLEQRGNREIAGILGLSEKAVDNRIRRMLARCRETILRQGLSLDDLIGAGK